jgi:hypothetical protein
MVGQSIDSYMPRTVDPAVWAEVGPSARAWVSLVPVEVTSQAVGLLKPLSQYLAWRHAGAMNAADPATVFRVDDIEQFIQNGCQHLTVRTRATYRSALLRVGEHVAGWQVVRPTQGLPIGAADPQAPYSPGELAAVLGAVSGRRTGFQRHNGLVIVALGRGAGLTAGDITALVGTDIEERHDGTVIVHVAGPNRRQVPVLASWATQVAGLGVMTGHHPMFRSDRTEIKRNDIARFCDRLVWRDAPRLNVSRLRATWIVEHLEAGTPLHLLAAAAGVRAASLARYAAYARPVEVDAAERLLTLRRDHA